MSNEVNLYNLVVRHFRQEIQLMISATSWSGNRHLGRCSIIVNYGRDWWMEILRSVASYNVYHVSWWLWLELGSDLKTSKTSINCWKQNVPKRFEWLRPRQWLYKLSWLSGYHQHHGSNPAIGILIYSSVAAAAVAQSVERPELRSLWRRCNSVLT